jgi:hypothetical protein
MKKLFLLIITSSFLLTGFSQNDLAKEILGVKDSSELIVRNSRKLVNNRLHEHNFTDLTKIITYANEHIDRNSYIAFYPWEEQVLSILSGDIDNFFLSVTNDKFNNYAISPQEDYLGQYAISLIREDKENKIIWFDNLLLDDEKKQVIRIFLGAVGLYDDPPENQKLLSHFLKKYPNSNYYKYVSSYKQTFDYGTFDFEFGGGVWKLNGGITQLVDPTSAFYFGMGGFLNRFYWSLFMMGANETKLQSTLLVKNDNDEQFTLNPGEDLSLINGGLKLGYLICRNKWLKLYPVATFTGTSLDLSSKEGRNSESITLNSTFGLGAGLCSDFDLIHWNATNSYSSNTAHLGIRLSVGYQSYIAGKKYIGGSGYYGTASLVWWVGKI